MSSNNITEQCNEKRETSNATIIEVTEKAALKLIQHAYQDDSHK